MSLLNSVDFPTLGLPMIASTGRSRERGIVMGRGQFMSQSHLSKRLGIPRPARVDPDKQLQKDSAPQQGFQFLSRLLADLLEHLPPFADQNRFVGIALGV